MSTWINSVSYSLTGQTVSLTIHGHTYCQGHVDIQIKCNGSPITFPPVPVTFSGSNVGNWAIVNQPTCNCGTLIEIFARCTPQQPYIELTHFTIPCVPDNKCCPAVTTVPPQNSDCYTNQQQQQVQTIVFDHAIVLSTDAGCTPALLTWDFGDGQTHSQLLTPGAGTVQLIHVSHVYLCGQSYSGSFKITVNGLVCWQEPLVATPDCCCCPKLQLLSPVFGNCINGIRTGTVNYVIHTATDPDCAQVFQTIGGELQVYAGATPIGPPVPFGPQTGPASGQLSFAGGLAPGTYTVTATFLRPEGCPPVTATFTVDACPSSNCCPDQLTLTPDHIGPCDAQGKRHLAVAYSISPKPGCPPPTGTLNIAGTTVTIGALSGTVPLYLAPGVYSGQLTITSPPGCPLVVGTFTVPPCQPTNCCPDQLTLTPDHIGPCDAQGKRHLAVAYSIAPKPGCPPPTGTLNIAGTIVTIGALSGSVPLYLAPGVYSGQLTITSPTGCPLVASTFTVDPCQSTTDCCPTLALSSEVGACKFEHGIFSRPVTISFGVTASSAAGCPDFVGRLTIHNNGGQLVHQQSISVGSNQQYFWDAPAPSSCFVTIHVDAPTPCPSKTVNIVVEPCDCCPEVKADIQMAPRCNDNDLMSTLICTEIIPKPNCPALAYEVQFDGATVQMGIVSTAPVMVPYAAELSCGHHDLEVRFPGTNCSGGTSLCVPVCEALASIGWRLFFVTMGKLAFCTLVLFFCFWLLNSNFKINLLLVAVIAVAFAVWAYLQWKPNLLPCWKCHILKALWQIFAGSFFIILFLSVLAFKHLWFYSIFQVLWKMIVILIIIIILILLPIIFFVIWKRKCCPTKCQIWLAVLETIGVMSLVYASVRSLLQGFIEVGISTSFDSWVPGPFGMDAFAWVVILLLMLVADQISKHCKKKTLAC
jgi:hypothetical protein